MKTLQTMLAVVVLSLTAACADHSPKRAYHRVSTGDDRQYNIQSHNFETSNQATGLEVGRRFAQ